MQNIECLGTICDAKPNGLSSEAHQDTPSASQPNPSVLNATPPPADGNSHISTPSLAAPPLAQDTNNLSAMTPPTKTSNILSNPEHLGSSTNTTIPTGQEVASNISGANSKAAEVNPNQAAQPTCEGADSNQSAPNLTRPEDSSAPGAPATTSPMVTVLPRSTDTRPTTGSITKPPLYVPTGSTQDQSISFPVDMTNKDIAQEAMLPVKNLTQSTTGHEDAAESAGI
ncbi:hypothetical protein PtA15_16A246 [Puccinia triticina]|uniref:Uncharacterized protein n=1 Tax=Puccinia triticina TaxID=208348 RepID=A0ABY7D625_9BASI|nr:uncharacterized protein PtA15_16A246 [Puccinia triticina]WAQ92340.1 hypothetical protein PtA15_16A246 [Puccinia triticina]